MSTIEKALGLLDHFSSQSPEIGLSDFKRLTDFDKGTTHRYLTSLKECGFIEQNPATKAYRLGPALIRLSAVREMTVPIRHTVRTFVDPIAAEMHELVHSSLPESRGMSTLYAVDGGISGTRVAIDSSEVLPFHATSSGIAQLAFGPKDLAARILRGPLKVFTGATPVAANDVQALIARAQQRGYAVADESYETDVCSVAVPFFDHTALSMGTLAIATPAARMTREMRARIVQTLTRTSVDLTRNLGGTIPADLYDLWTSGEALIARNR